MDVCSRLKIGVRGEVLAPSASPLFFALGSLFPVEFHPWANGDCHGLDALILTGLDPEHIRCAAGAGLPLLAVPAPLSTTQSGQVAEYRLGESPFLSAYLRSRRFEERECVPTTDIRIWPGDVVFATRNGRPIWVERRVEGATVTLVAQPLPYLALGDHIYENFRFGNFLRLLPILQFLRNLTSQTDWQSPSTTACLLVDDPSLHAKTYGYVDFRKLVARTREQGFCVSVAMVPLDCWGISRAVGELFRKNASRVSVLLHGNDHTYEELARPGSEAENLSLLAQALRRFQRLEDTGIEVCRVMESPHGSISVAMLEPMARLGYEAAFASTAHLLRCNCEETFPFSLGAERTLTGKRAVTVIPRIRATTGWQTEVRLAAFLRQPIVLAAHHWDFAGDRTVAEEFVDIVNSLPEVGWASPTGIARTCYQFRQVGDTLHVKLGSRLVNVSVPHSAQRVIVHRPWLRGAEEPELLVVRDQKNEIFHSVSGADVIGPLPLGGETSLRVSSSLPDPVDFNAVPPPRLHYWPLVRKLMVEVRDRSRMPVHAKRHASH